MSGKPAARLNDPTSCPIPGHGTNPIAAGSPDVLFDGLPAARMGDASACGGALASAVIPTVLINSMPSTTVGTVGSHGNTVTAGSGTVIIGMSGGGAAFSAPSAMPATAAAAAAAPKASAETSTTATATTAVAAAVATALVDAFIPAAQAAEASSEELDYRLRLKSGGNRVLTPLGIPDYKELKKGTTKNSEKIDFLVHNRKQVADNLTLEVLDGSTVVYAEPNTATLLPIGEHIWQWDGYNQAGVLDTKVLKSPDLMLRLTAVRGGQRQIVELRLSNKAKEVDWVDSKIDRNARTVEVTVRPSFSDGGVKGSIPGLTPTPYEQRESFAKAGIELHWSRNGTRAPGIGNAISAARGAYQLTVIADLGNEPKAATFPLTENLTSDGGRSTSFGIFRTIHHNLGWAYSSFAKAKISNAELTARDYACEDFLYTAAHEFGHLILNSYGDGGLVPHYSWTHKGSSTLMQNEIEGTETPRSGEVDVMHYFMHHTVNSRDRWSRTVAAEEDAKGLIWLARVKFHD